MKRSIHSELSTISIVRACSVDLTRAQKFYDDNGYRGTAITPDDLVFLARVSSDEGQIVGIGRLCFEHGVWCLRGMRIENNYQRQGIGTLILEHIVNKISAHDICYCLPYRHLEAFYAQSGFQKCHVNDLPEYLKIRLHKYLASGIEVMAMLRLP